MLRILHTADWHLGASLESVSRDADHSLFLDWLFATLEQRKVQVLVIAGDVFDQAQPSAEASRLYFNFLDRVARARLVRKVVVVGGNHDSPSRLDAPRELLDALEVHVVGGLDEKSRDRCLCPIRLGDSGIDAVALAVPYVNEVRLGMRSVLEGGAAAGRDLRDRFAALYTDLADRAQKLAPGAPLFATGHLACVGSKSGDAPVDIHLVGSLGGLPADVFDPRIRYVALGHIHRGYRVAQSAAWYAGSPIALNLKEAAQPRRVLLVDLPGDGDPRVESIEVPAFRAIVENQGSCELLTEWLRTLAWQTPLPPLAYAVVQENALGSVIESRLHEAAAKNRNGEVRLVSVKPAVFANGQMPALGAPPERLQDLEPEQVFERLCHSKQLPLDEPLRLAFRTILGRTTEEESR